MATIKKQYYGIKFPFTIVKQDGFFVDAGLSAKFGKEVNVISGLNHLAGKTVIALSNGGVIENLKVSDDGKVHLPIKVNEITIPSTGDFISVYDSSVCAEFKEASACLT